MRKFLPLLLTLASGLFFIGCATKPQSPMVRDLDPSEPGFVQGTGVESMDVVAITDTMVRKLNSSSPISAFSSVYGKAPRIRLESIRNRTRFPIDQNIMLTRMRGLLNESAQGSMVFLARGSAYDMMPVFEEERNLKRANAVSSTKDITKTQFSGADYILTGTLQSLTTQTTAGVGDYVLYAFQLIDPNTSEIVWEGMAETKRQANISAAYR
jgi:PBP1b-binding outer membrane lipoprotein LpoB